jgi:hypothetical protein
LTKKPRTIFVSGDDAFIPLTQGYVAVISADDVHLVSNFCWSAHVDRRKDGTIKNVYAQRVTSKDVDGKQRTIMLHRLILGFPDGRGVDHIDMDGLNNRRPNLRAASQSENACNKNVRADSTTRAKGVTMRSSGRYQASIAFAKKRHFLGTFATEREAVQAYAAASARLHGDFGRT